MTTTSLIVITGPVGGGKSTTAIQLATCLRERGLTTAVVGLDDVYLMASQRHWAEQDAWTAARRGCGALADSFFASGFDAVVVEGGVFDTQEVWSDLRESVKSQVNVTFWTLVVSWEETLRRTAGDPNRRTLNEKFLKLQHEEFTSALRFLRDASECIETDQLAAVEVAKLIADEAFPQPDAKL